jgi:hypothetical protein
MPIPLIAYAIASAGFTIMASRSAARAQERAADARARAARRQAQIDADVANLKIQQDNREEAEEVRVKRDEQYRRRRLIAAQYGASGVELSGSALDTQLRQVAVDESNVQRIHGMGNERRGLSRWNMFEQYKQDIFSLESNKYAAYQQAKATRVQGIASAAGTIAMGKIAGG